jgi:hypothetical protein
MMVFGPTFHTVGVGIVAMSACVRKCFTNGYVSFRVSINFWAATWKLSYQNKGSKEKRREYIGALAWLRLLFGF